MSGTSSPPRRPDKPIFSLSIHAFFPLFSIRCITIYIPIFFLLFHSSSPYPSMSLNYISHFFNPFCLFPFNQSSQNTLPFLIHTSLPFFNLSKPFFIRLASARALFTKSTDRCQARKDFLFTSVQRCNFLGDLKVNKGIQIRF